MEKNIKNEENENNNILLDDEQQSEEANRKILCHKNFPNEFVNGRGSNQDTVILKYCKEVHVGPKFECHNYVPTTSDPNKIDLRKTSIFVKCKERLKNRYITNFQYMRSFFWDGKRNDLPIKDHFVELVVEKSNLYGKKEGEKINLEEIFTKEVEGHQTILFSGEYGYGKTTLCKKIAYDWAADKTSFSYLKHFDLVVVILLRGLNGKSLYNLVLYNIFQNAEGEINSEIENENLNTLVMLDGFDEISNKSQVLKFIREESFDISLRMTIVVTSRPQVTEDIREDMKSRFSVEGFSEQQQQKYIELIFKDHEDKGKQLSEMLKENEFVSGIRKCPLMLHMLCCLYLNDDMDLLGSITDLYIRMFSLLIKRYISKNGGNYNFRKGKYFLGEDLLIRLGKSKIIFSYIITDLKKLFPIEEEYNFIVGLGILEFYSFSAYDEQSYYHFVHFSFYEFIQALTTYFYFSPVHIPDNVLLFVMGLSGREQFPKKLHYYFNKRHTYRPKFMLQAYREIKIKTNWELFCSLSRLIFSYTDLDDVQALLPLYDFTQVHFIFPEDKSTYEKYRNNLINFYKNYNFSEKLVIFLFASIDINETLDISEIDIDNLDIARLYGNILDLRAIMNFIIDFFYGIGTIKNKIYFCGIYFGKDAYFLRGIKLMIQLPKYTQEKLNVEENQKFVALRFIYIYDYIVDYFITAEQYETLRDRIRCFPFPNWKRRCMIV